MQIGLFFMISPLIIRENFPDAVNNRLIKLYETILQDSLKCLSLTLVTEGAISHNGKRINIQWGLS